MKFALPVLSVVAGLLVGVELFLGVALSEPPLKADPEAQITVNDWCDEATYVLELDDCQSTQVVAITPETKTTFKSYTFLVRVVRDGEPGWLIKVVAMRPDGPAVIK